MLSSTELLHNIAKNAIYRAPLEHEYANYNADTADALALELVRVAFQKAKWINLHLHLEQLVVAVHENKINYKGIGKSNEYAPEKHDYAGKLEQSLEALMYPGNKEYPANEVISGASPAA